MYTRQEQNVKIYSSLKFFHNYYKLNTQAYRFDPGIISLSGVITAANKFSFTINLLESLIYLLKTLLFSCF